MGLRRGEVRLVELDPSRGSEANTTRPAVLVSNDAANEGASRRGRGVITVVPLTTNVTRVHPFQVFVPARESGLRKDSKTQAEQVRAVAVERVGDRLGRLTPRHMAELEAALRLHLGL